LTGVAYQAGFRDGALHERKACADIADQHNSCEGIAEKIATAIRQRGEDECVKALEDK